ncbi:hypothetical protein, partial [Pokkaliibacter plantistimulans]|uniref:hypothetical protein n=1 Tax=Pokkaliibacter plantistimulans TaxID=1635171 RepID=UPI001A9CA865
GYRCSWRSPEGVILHISLRTASNSAVCRRAYRFRSNNRFACEAKRIDMEISGESELNRLLKNVIEAAETRKKQAKKRSLVN